MSCGEGIPMFEVALALVGLAYIAAQWLVAMNFRDYWRLASFLPVPVLATIVFGSLYFDLALPLGITGTLLVGLPLGLVYLMALSALHLALRAFKTEAPLAPPAPVRGAAVRIVSEPRFSQRHG